MENKKCNKCNRLKSIKDFNYKNKKTKKLSSTCRECSSNYLKTHYILNKTKYKEKALKWNRKKREENSRLVFEYLKANPCVMCGETDPIVLEFDHINRLEKTANISDLTHSTTNIVIIMAEIKKCQVLCANCHRRKTAEEFNWKMLVYKNECS